MGNKDFKDRDIDYEINLKANTIDIVRTARVLASNRLYGYSEKWELIFLIMSVLSTGLLIFSIISPENRSRLAISAFFSIYSLLVQNFISKINYNERALKYHYHQLELENLLLELKYILLKKDLSEDEKFTKYKHVMSRYQISLQGYENHSEIDHKKAKKNSKKYFNVDVTDSSTTNLQNNSNGGLYQKSINTVLKEYLTYKDFSWNIIFIYVQVIVILGVLYLYYINGGNQ